MILNIRCPHFAMFDNAPVVDPPAPPVIEPTAGQGGKPPAGFLPQAKVNELIANERRTWQAKLEPLTEQLEVLKGSASLTEEERTNYTTQIEQLRGMYQTKEQQALVAAEKQKKEASQKITDLENQAKGWQERYTKKEIAVAIRDAASEHKAVQALQIEAILRPHTAVQEVLGEDGKPTGEFMPRVKLPHVDNKGAPVVLDLSVNEAVKIMKETDIYANLFIDERTGGAGVRPSGKTPPTLGANGKPSLETLSKLPPKEFKKVMTEHPDWFKQN